MYNFYRQRRILAHYRQQQRREAARAKLTGRRTAGGGARYRQALVGLGAALSHLGHKLQMRYSARQNFVSASERKRIALMK